jgi:hypothetical protein
MMAAITRDEWLKALSEAGYQDDVDDRDAVTLDEFAAMCRIPRSTADSRMRALVLAGKAEKTRKWGVNSYGRRLQYVAYRLVPAPKKRRAA